MPSDKRSPATTAIEALNRGALDVVGRVPSGGNVVLLLDVEFEGAKSRAIYKPIDGEEPLWDFPDGLFRREAAAYQLSVALGWPNIPETVVREDAPFGVGSLQRFIDADFSQHYFSLAETDKYNDALKAIAVFDVIANNTDRKSGHCLIDAEDIIWAIDNALCFNPDPKLRTVIWEYQEEPIDADLLGDIARVRAAMPAEVTELLASEEVRALQSRMDEIVDNPVMPSLLSQRQYPWPLI